MKEVGPVNIDKITERTCFSQHFKSHAELCNEAKKSKGTAEAVIPSYIGKNVQK